MKLKSLGLSLREIRELLRSPGDGPYGLTANLCKELIERLSAQRDAVEAALAQLRGLGQSPTRRVTQQRRMPMPSRICQLLNSASPRSRRAFDYQRVVPFLAKIE